MTNHEVIIATIIEDSWLTLEQLAAWSDVEADWLISRINDGLFPHAESIGGTWRFTQGCLQRAQRMYRLEHHFDAVPELAALVTDLQDEVARLRRKLQQFELQRR